ncbi:MAG: zinc ribbon domain-containing protein [Treponema sp.]|nr:zinc ribbon domain-containing protein [Treponema sp.]
MPTYEYECKSCSHNFEIFQSMSDQPLKDCPECGKEIRRLIFGGAGVIFKGSGFYVTDKGKSAGSETKAAGTVASAGKTETKSDSAVPSAPCAECPKKGASASCPV